jgi:hypothetical protein
MTYVDFDSKANKKRTINKVNDCALTDNNFAFT